LIVAVAVLVGDVVSKVLVVRDVEGRQPVELLGGLVWFSVHRNPGAAWSMATGMTWLLTVVAVVVVVAILRLSAKLRSPGWAIGLGLVLGGALGNLVDRFLRSPGPMRGHVVDFVSVFAPYGEYFPVFNVADSGICVGGLLIVLLAFLGRDYDGTIAVPVGRKDTARG
jgi:signal peptidase II